MLPYSPNPTSIFLLACLGLHLYISFCTLASPQGQPIIISDNTKRTEILGQRQVTLQSTSAFTVHITAAVVRTRNQSLNGSVDSARPRRTQLDALSVQLEIVT